MEQSAAFITRYEFYSLLKDERCIFCSQEAEIATPSPDLSYVPYTGSVFKLQQKYMDLFSKIFVPSEEQSPWAAVASGLDTSHLYRRTGDAGSSNED